MYYFKNKSKILACCRKRYLKRQKYIKENNAKDKKELLDEFVRAAGESD